MRQIDFGNACTTKRWLMNIAQALALRGEVNSYEHQENIWLLEHFLGLSALELKISPCRM